MDLYQHLAVIKKNFLWDVKTGQFTLASGSNDNTIRLWDVKTGQQKIKLDGHRNSVKLSPDDTILAYGSSDNSIRFWDGKSGKEIQSQDKNYKDIFYQDQSGLQIIIIKCVIKECCVNQVFFKQIISIFIFISSFNLMF
ncbi:unnamed protein product [Paramecium pentaurelia]|uniref:Uncharacterized protein n=1 Tax=Paramecium pentaurelia TaxID=43138 RepID=A0A8S1WNF6_9CILI|nr:unnamed protein product [Paramecium pentaurelia]